MTLNEDNYIDIINTYHRANWQPFFDLIRQIESTGKFGKIADREKDESGLSFMPHYVENSIVTKFRECVDQLGISIVFDWPNWEEGRAMVEDKKFNFDTIDIPMKCKLITAIIRNDRFCEGALVSSFNNGVMLKILKSIEKQVNL